jgi:hypothetical protein
LLARRWRRIVWHQPHIAASNAARL